MRFTTSIGNFEFPDETLLIDAKAVRDTVMSGFLTDSVKSGQSMVRYLHNWNHRANVVPFTFHSTRQGVPHFEVGLTSTEEDVTQPALPSRTLSLSELL